MSKEFIKNFYYLFWIFIVGCIAGWVIEGIFTFVKHGVIINHSALVLGPFNVAYGFGACLLSVLLVQYEDDNYFKIFCIGFFSGTILEYIMSLGMELVLGFTSWNYSSKFLNINGRVCLTYSIFWGILAIFWIKLIYPYLIKLVKKLNYSVGKKIMFVLLIFLAFDVLFTFFAIARAKEAERGIPPGNRCERFLDKTFNQKYLKNMYNNSWGDK